MNVQGVAVAATTVLALATGFGGEALAAQQPENEVAPCVLGEWESTAVIVEHEDQRDFEIGGGSGVLLVVDEDGPTTANFTDMDQITFEGDVDDTTVRGHVEYRGEATGTVRTTDEGERSGTLRPSDVNWGDVEVTVVLTDPFDSRPLDQVPVEDLRRLATDRGHMAVPAPVLSESTYQCEDDTLTLTSTVVHEGAEHDEETRDRAEITWRFERPADE